MPKISSYNYQGPLAYSDRLIGVFSGATNGVSLQQFRDFFGVGTNWKYLVNYPNDPTDPVLGKDGDFLVLANNNVYQRSGGTFPPVGAPLFKMRGTIVDDAVISTETSWSSRKIDEYVRGAVAVVLNFKAGDVVKTIPFFSRVLLESFRSSLGTDAYAMRLLLADGSVIITAQGTAAACIGQVSVSISSLTPTQVAGGYNVEVSYTGNSSAAAGLLRTIPLS